MGGYIMSSTINADTTNGVVVTSDTSGEIELQSNGVTKAKVTANGLQDANGNSLRGGMYRNLIINGDMQVAQRATSKTGITNSSGVSYQTVDRFTLGGSAQAFGTWTQSQDTDVPSGQGFAKSFKMDCTTSSTDDGQILLQHRIEGQMLQYLKKGTSSAESLTLSFWVKSNKTGTYIAELYDKDNDRQISYAYTIDTADTWEKKIITYDGDTTGAFDNDNDRSLDVILYLKASSALSSGTLNTSWAATVSANRAVGQVNLADSTSNYINIAGVQLEVGEGASDFEFLPYDVQLARCQRYYQTSYGADSGVVLTAQGLHWIAYSGSILIGALMFPVKMRATPTMVIYGSYSGTANRIETVSNTLVSGTFAFVGHSKTKATQANGSGLAANAMYQFEFTASAEL